VEPDDHDWPEQVPISKWELDFFEALLGDELDRILGILKSGRTGTRSPNL